MVIRAFRLLRRDRPAGPEARNSVVGGGHGGGALVLADAQTLGDDHLEVGHAQKSESAAQIGLGVL
jgi:hypothetical protein